MGRVPSLHTIDVGDRIILWGGALCALWCAWSGIPELYPSDARSSLSPSPTTKHLSRHGQRARVGRIAPVTVSLGPPELWVWGVGRFLFATCSSKAPRATEGTWAQAWRGLRAQVDKKRGREPLSCAQPWLALKEAVSTCLLSSSAPRRQIKNQLRAGSGFARRRRESWGHWAVGWMG